VRKHSAYRLQNSAAKSDFDRFEAAGKVRDMSALWTTIAMTLAMAATNVLGTVCLKLSSEPNKQEFFAAGIVAYIVAAALYVALLKEHSLAVLSVGSSVLQLGTLCTLSIWWFGDKISFVQGSAMAMAVVAATIAMLAAIN